MNKLKIAFFGTPTFAARVLQQLIDDKDLPVELTFIVTQPDKKAGRKQVLTPTPVKLLAQKNNIPLFDSIQAAQSALKTVDLVLLYAYGELLPADILKLPKWGFWNIHPSLLPKYRGTSPIAYSLLLGDKVTGVSLMQMDERMDHGPVFCQEQYEIQVSDTREDLENKLSDIGYKLFKICIQKQIDGLLEKQEQNHDKRTFTRLLTKQDGFLPFDLVQKIIQGNSVSNLQLPQIMRDYNVKNKLSDSSNQELSEVKIVNLYKALSPWPGLWTLLPNEKRLKITGIDYKEGVLSITKVQLEGKKEVDIKTFLLAYPLE